MYWLTVGVVLLAMGLGLVALDRRIRRSVGAPEEPLAVAGSMIGYVLMFLGALFALGGLAAALL